MLGRRRRGGRSCLELKQCFLRVRRQRRPSSSARRVASSTLSFGTLTTDGGGRTDAQGPRSHRTRPALGLHPSKRPAAPANRAPRRRPRARTATVVLRCLGLFFLWCWQLKEIVFSYIFPAFRFLATARRAQAAPVPSRLFWTPRSCCRLQCGLPALHNAASECVRGADARFAL